MKDNKKDWSNYKRKKYQQENDEERLKTIITEKIRSNWMIVDKSIKLITIIIESENEEEE